MDGDGLIGRSDIFSSITVSAEGKEIVFSGGLIPVGGRFTDINLAFSDNPPDFAGIDSFFSGTVAAVPVPPAWVLVFSGLGTLVAGRIGRRRGGRTAQVI